ncbi:type IV secretion system DNA-binding domain-containing protein [Xanthomonas albilineans]|uniref:Probable conjugal transfer protein n=1 Tax=Xanthomonas albilineans (strain GPE PC73 / CFBP 7063) TaxID=380358 RepID=D6CKA7_XANAP|nr:type IV secretion system DNA-binding domain-containing protein [Xanthomonas albilineans]CAZ15896.1 probable conjugal transfer protein [Xanthomonas albilineans]
MEKMDRNRLIAALWLFGPILGWLYAFKFTEKLTGDHRIKQFVAIAGQTTHKPFLLAGIVGGFVGAAILTWAILAFFSSPFEGHYFKRWLRGTKIVGVDNLKSVVREKKARQVEIGGIPVPTKAETLHILFGGSTGTGKSVAMRSLAYSLRMRGDRMVVCDPNGDLLTKFYRPGDKILNPYDKRSEGWSFYNEIRADYDYKRYALSIVPRGKSNEEEQWCSFGRLLLAEAARKLAMTGNYNVRDLFHWTTIAEPKELKNFLEGTAAESLFVGAEKALASARFVLSDKLPEHLEMPQGDFSIRRFLEDDQNGSLFITWREDMAVALRPLISAWVDVVCTSVLSMPESNSRRLWLILDELASLEKLASLQDALTKGRKHGLRVAAGLQTVSQLDDLYGQKQSQTLRGSLRSLVVLGGAKTDPETAEVMSRSLGEHEVIRDDKSVQVGLRNSSRNTREKHEKERVVLPEQITSLPDLHAYMAFAGNYPIAKTVLEVQNFKEQVPAFDLRLGT